METGPRKGMNLERTPPNDSEAERAVLGCILISPQESVAVCEEMFTCGQEVFYDRRHGTIYKACLDLAADRRTPDTITVCDHLKGMGALEEVGGSNYVAALEDVPTTYLQLPEYLRIVADKYRMRRLISLCTSTALEAYEANGDSDSIVEAFEVEAMKIRESSQAVSGLVDIHRTILSLTDKYQAAHLKGEPLGISTGYTKLDAVSGAMMEGELILLAGIQSSGKTTLAMNIAWNVAQHSGVGIFSLETTGEKLIHRLVCTASEFNGSVFLRGKATEGDFRSVTTAFGKIKRVQDRLLINETGAMTMGQISASARRMHKAGARLFIIDYLQLVNTGGKSEYERTTATSKLIKNLAKETNCPVIAISSLSRASSQDGRKPQLSDLRASGQLEYDANKVWLLSCDEKTEQKLIEVHVAKNKDGPTGKTQLFYNTPHFKMHNLAPGHYDDESNR